MTTLLARLQADMKLAMKSGDALTRDTLRLAITDLNKKELDLARALQPEEELAVLKKCVNGREDLAERERSEIGVLRRYLPTLLGEPETKALVQAAIQKLGLTSKKDLGQVMKAVLAEHKGQVEGKLVQKLASELLG